MLVILISFGHSASQAPVLVQLPNPSSSICATIDCTRRYRSGWPCGSMPNWLTLAETNSIAEAFLQAATQAPQPMQVAELKASSAITFGIGISFASGTPPVFTDTNPPACCILSNDERSTTRSFITGNGPARQGSMVMVCPSWKLRMCSWQVVIALFGPCGCPLIYSEHIPQIPSRQSWSKCIGSSPLC